MNTIDITTELSIINNCIHVPLYVNTKGIIGFNLIYSFSLKPGNFILIKVGKKALKKRYL